MTQPLGNCPGCGADEPFEQVHPGECPDVDGECPEWACTGCGAGVFMGTVIVGTPPLTVAAGTAGAAGAAGAAGTAADQTRQAVRAA